MISPLLANIYLHPLDRLMAESGYRMVRYADDFVILCRTAQEAQAALRRAMAWVADACGGSSTISTPCFADGSAYFKQAAPSIHRHLDGFIRRRLRAILRKQEKRPGFGRCPNDHQRWPNTFFADLGLFTLSTARYHARHPR